MSLRTKLHPMGGGKGKDKIIQVACSDYTTWYLTESGDLYGCGYNNNSQQSSGDTNDVLTFTKRASNVAQVVCSDYTTWYIDKTGNLYGCGSNSKGQQGSGTYGSNNYVSTFTKRASNVAQVVCSRYTTWYINTSGDLYGCGLGNYGQQGSGNTGRVSTFKKRASNVVQIACSDETTWYINTSGDLYGCGYNNYGQQGSGNTNNVSTFTKRASNVAYVTCSDETTWYINTTAQAYRCGRSNYGQLSYIMSTLTLFTSLTDVSGVQKLYCSEDTTWCLNQNNRLYGCGNNDYGQQGDGSSGTNVQYFNQNTSLYNIYAIVCSTQTTWCLIWATLDGGLTWSYDLYGCGLGDHGQQGNGTYGSNNYVSTFTKRASNVAQAACSRYTTWYITKSGDLYGCGSNSKGQQGSGDTNDVLTFTKRN